MFKLRLLTAAAATAFLAGAATAAPQSAQPDDATPPASSATRAPDSDTAATPARTQQSAAATQDTSGRTPTSKEGMSESTTRAWVEMDLEETTVGNSRLFVGTITDSAGQSMQIITNGPVPDNAQNRAEFPPLSAAGRRTRPLGN